MKMNNPDRQTKTVSLPFLPGDEVFDLDGCRYIIRSVEIYANGVLGLHCDGRTFTVGKRSIGRSVFASAEDAEKRRVKET